MTEASAVDLVRHLTAELNQAITHCADLGLRVDLDIHHVQTIAVTRPIIRADVFRKL